MILLDVETKKKRIEANWRLEDIDEVPFTIEVGAMHMATNKYYNLPQAEIEWAEDLARKREGVYDYGFSNIKPNQGINIVASAFGCEYTVNDEADPWVKCLIREENIDDIDGLKIPDPDNNPVFVQAWKHVEALQNLSSMPLRMLNVPSPLVTASLIWDYTSFVEATLIYPDEAHAILEKVTEATILYIREAFKRIKNLYSVGHEFPYIPQECGIRISDDTAALFSPDLYHEFGVKYNAMISKEFGGIVVHSCGDVQHVVEAMVEIPYLRGLDFTIPQVSNWSKIRDYAAGKTVLCLRHLHWDHESDANVNLAEYSKKLIDYFGRKGVFIQTSSATHEEAVILGEKLHKVLSQ